VLAQYYHTGTVPLHAWLHAQQTVFARQQRTRSAAAVAASCRVLQHGFRSCFACNHACPPSPSLPPGCSLAGHAVACVGLPSRNRHRSASFLLPDAGPPGGSVVHLLWSCTCCMPLLAGSVAPLRWGGSCPAGPAATTPSSPPCPPPPPPRADPASRDSRMQQMWGRHEEGLDPDHPGETGHGCGCPHALRRSATAAPLSTVAVLCHQPRLAALAATASSLAQPASPTCHSTAVDQPPICVAPAAGSPT
jgi:hypothetical protein